MPLDASNVARGSRMPCVVEIPGELQIQPELRVHAEHLLEPQRRIGRDAAFAVNQFIDSWVRRADPLRQLHLRHSKRLEELLAEHRSRMGGSSVGWDSDGRRA